MNIEISYNRQISSLHLMAPIFLEVYKYHFTSLCLNIIKIIYRHKDGDLYLYTSKKYKGR